MRYLCLKTAKVLTLRELRRTRRNIMFTTKATTWPKILCEAGKFRIIHDTPPPEDLSAYTGNAYDSSGFEERNGELYQTWVKR